MADVGIRELKQRLSEYLDRAEGGEVLRVTDRGRPKAQLGPVPGRARRIPPTRAQAVATNRSPRPTVAHGLALGEVKL